jgi:glucose-1-phosphate cytidylyltransferase
MQVVILCGGKGTRLREETEYRPKPMVPIGDYPILWHIMKIYAHYGHTDFILCLGYKGNVIKDYFLSYQTMLSDFSVRLGNRNEITYHGSPVAEDWRVTLANTGEDTMTGGRVKRIEKYITGDQFMLTYGDGVGDVNVDALVKFHQRHRKLATMTGVRPPGRFGEVTTKKDRVTVFNEKPQATGGLINGGFFVLSRGIFKYLNDDSNLVFENDPLRNLTADGQLMCYAHEGFWQPMDTFREFELLNRLWKTDRAPWKVW